MMNTTRNEATLNELLSAVRDYGTACSAWGDEPDNADYETACVDAYFVVRQIAERIIEPSELDKRDAIDTEHLRIRPPLGRYWGDTRAEPLTEEHQDGDA